MGHAQANKLLAEMQALERELIVRKVNADGFYWLTNLTKTKDEQATRFGADPYRPFPKKEYLWATWQALTIEPILFIEKSRTMMASWIVAGFCAHFAFTNPATCVVFQSEDLDRAKHDIDYVKTLWEQSPDFLKERWPLTKQLDRQPQESMQLANGSRLVAIPGNPDKIRSEHPTIVVLDEAAIITEGEQSYNVAMAASPVKVVCLSSAKPGWFQEFTESAVPVKWPYGRQPENERKAA